ncbi:FecR family protein [Thalassotalea castellviae]|uniref:FecR family protein n=1 Tax=Thalassotalea castellviae TaxID=3075612 RepID=A0ABU2ZX42_9GAMM|nr:FecR family protein [Thalassotalea sp. W431]MDT0602497.1 FecR family protein [Thalassotalea sp. W431]
MIKSKMKNSRPMHDKTGISSKIKSLILFTLSFCLVSSSYASVAGKTILAKGEVLAIGEEGTEVRALKRRSKIFDVDEITTGKSSKAQFNMTDGGLITLKESTKVLISDYQYDGETEQGSATLELVNGGLRSISGLIKAKGGDYKVKTPVGSIGIRGTHFVVQVIDDNVIFGVYSGNIDVDLTGSDQTLSLGETEDFAFATVDGSGQVTTYTQAPIALSKGFVSDAVETISESTEQTEQPSSPTVVDEEVNVAFDASVYQEEALQAISDESIADLISQRSGSVTFDQIVESSINSSVGDTSNFQMSMTVDFDNASVPGGSLSFNDAQGEWLATFSGLINIDQLSLGVNYASHGNNKVQGNISAAFSNGLDELLGNFNLSEIDDASVNADGTFKIKP